MALTESSIIVEITTLPLENNIQVKWRNSIERDGEVISSAEHYKLFSEDRKAEFIAEVLGADAYITAMGW